jgi:hypothetical protein
MAKLKDTLPSVMIKFSASKNGTASAPEQKKILMLLP